MRIHMRVFIQIFWLYQWYQRIRRNNIRGNIGIGKQTFSMHRMVSFSMIKVIVMVIITYHTPRLAMLQDGRFYIVQTTIQGQIYLRTALMNPFTTIEDLEELLGIEL